MSDCPTSSRKIALIQNLLARMRSLSCIWQKVALWTGWTADTRTVYAMLQNRVYSAGQWSITWLSTPGRYYSVMQSSDGGLTWLTVAVAVPAEATPSKTTSWIGPGMAYVDTVFRVVTLPPGFQLCYTTQGIWIVPNYDPRLDPLASLS